MEQIKNNAPVSCDRNKGNQINIDSDDNKLLRDEVNYFNNDRCCLPSYLRCEQTIKHCNDCGMFRRKAKADMHYHQGKREDLPSIQPRYKSGLVFDRKKRNFKNIESIWNEAIELQKKKRGDVF